MNKLILATMLAVISFQSVAAFYDGNELSQWNNARKRVLNNSSDGGDLMRAGMFRGFVTGTFGAYQNVVVCTDGRSTVGQIEDVVGLYLDNHPELRTRNATVLVADALSVAFPCKK
ncbi:hypothetical protein LCD50_13435 [Enterobacter kobei]|uniref:Rap1a/Tai family immunity protein n=1 Tax=Enterobacter kobei TaxID=208224 RepID=UPI001FF15118|nr:Rap1a/Tai family immunity protein [Enterobacter kobei]UOY35614.1 hypothetical protein LCD50_13435 [Enterobacter kobei]